MKRKIIAGLAVVTLGLGMTASAASAAPPAPAKPGKPLGVSCQQYGLAFLRSLGAPAKVTKSQLGQPLKVVLDLHRYNPAQAGALLVRLGQDQTLVEAACGPIAPTPV